MRSGARGSAPGSGVPWSHVTSRACGRTSSSAFAWPSHSASTSAALSSPFLRVPATRMDGAALAARMREEIKQEVEELGHVGLATVLVGEDPASEIYIRLKHKASEEAGIE